MFHIGCSSLCTPRPRLFLPETSSTHKHAPTCHALLQELPDPRLPTEITDAFDVAFNNIKAFHQAQQQTQALEVETMPGVRCKRVTRPIGGCSAWTAVLFEVELMPGVKCRV